ncbi:MAG: sulfide-dependent adenosine diphosphate thiazole synthase [bacterium]
MGKFTKVSENQVTSAIVKDFCEEFLKNVKTDVIIVGAGPSGLMAGRRLAKDGFKVLIVEANNYLGGGFWIGGYLMNGITVREPANEVLDEIGAPYKKMEEGLYLASGPHACSKLIASACDAGVKILNMTKFDDVVLRENNRVAGVVVNWTPVSALPRAITCVDPIALESKLVIDATGHDAVIANALAKRNLLKIEGFGGMWVEKSEDMVVEKTSEVHPGLIVAGMAVSTVFGIPRMGPTFGGMLLSGEKAAEIAKEAMMV